MTQESNIFPYIERLLQGAEVVWKPLGEVAEYEQPTKYLVKSSNYKDIYPTPVLTAGKTFILGYTDETEGIYKASISPVIIFDDFTTANKWVDFDFKAKSSAMKMITSKNEKELLLKYIYYWLNTLPSELIEGDHKRQWISNYANKKIPLPPLSVQQEIVRILDKFTELEAELEAELDCRKRQYEYYRNHLLSYEGKEVEWKTLGEVGTFIRGNGLQKKDFVETGIGCIHYGQIYTYYGIKASETISYVTEDLAKSLRKASHNDLIIAGVSENIEDVCKCVVWEGEEDICVSGDTFIFKTDQNPHYIGHLLRTDNFLNYKRKNAIGAKVTRLQAGSLPKYTIPLPPLEEQQRIATILDKFDTLVNSISEGLPKEIALRRKQYEYYREKLLTFTNDK